MRTPVLSDIFSSALVTCYIYWNNQAGNWKHTHTIHNGKQKLTEDTEYFRCHRKLSFNVNCKHSSLSYIFDMFSKCAMICLSYVEISFSVNIYKELDGYPFYTFNLAHVNRLFSILYDDIVYQRLLSAVCGEHIITWCNSLCKKFWNVCCIP